MGQLAVTYAGLADFFGDVSYQAEDAWLEEISKSSEERWHKDTCQEYLLPNVPGNYSYIYSIFRRVLRWILGMQGYEKVRFEV